MRIRSFITGLAVVVILSVGLLAPAMAQDGGQPFIGIRFVQEESGARIEQVVADSPADTAGLQRNDLITAIDGTAITLDSSLIAVVDSYAPGDTVQLTVDRSGEILEIALTLGTRSGDEPAASPPAAEEGELRRHISVAGATFVDLGDRWHVAGLEPDSLAEEAGLLPGDMIVSVDGHPISAYDSGVLATVATEGGDLLLVLQRGTSDLELTLTLPPGTTVTSTIEPSIIMPPSAPAVEPTPTAPAPPPPAMEQPEAKGYLGVAFVPLNQEVLDSLAADDDLPFEMPTASEGALIIGVQEDSPAGEAGIVMGDVVVEVDGDRVDEERTLADRIYAYEEGDTIVITILRGADALELEITLMARPPELGPPGMPMTPPSGPALTPFAPFMDPDFDLDQFLEENPSFLDDLEALGLPGLMGPMFADPDFDWAGFLSAHPGFLALMERLSETYTPEELEELFPEFPWFGEYDPFHEDMDPRMPTDQDNAPA